MKTRLGTILFGCVLAGLPAAAQQAVADRTSVLADIRQKYPQMPEAVAGHFADVSGRFLRETRCEVMDWFASAPAGVAARDVERGEIWGNVCMLPVDGITPEIAVAKLADKPFMAEVEGDVMTVFARADTQPSVCCSPEVEMVRLGDGPYWARRIRMKHLDRAATQVIVTSWEGAATEAFENRFIWRGPNALAEHRQIPRSETRGRVEQAQIDSVALGERRRLAIYLPPGWTKEKTWPAVFIGDGGEGTFFPMVEAMIADGLIEPVVLVGVEAGWDAQVDADPTQKANHPNMRNDEYMPDRAPDIFDRHLSYFADEVTDWAVREYNVSTRREDRLVTGFSGGGTFALFAGLRRPDVFGYAVPLSPAYTLPEESDLKPGQRAIFHMSGGLYEPDFYRAAKHNAAAMRVAGYDVTVEHPASGHFPDHWQLVLGNALLRFFPKR